MAYQLSNEIKQQIQKDAEKLKNRNGQQKTSGNTSGGFANNTTAQNGNNAGRGLMTPPANNYQLSDEIKSQIQKDAEKLRSRSKNYNIGAVALDDATGKGTQPTTGYYNEYGIYTIPDPNAPQQQSYAPAAPTRTRADIEKEIAQREQELNLVYGEVDAAQGDSWKMTDIKNRAKGINEELEQLNAELWMLEQGEIYSAVPGYSDFAKNSAVTGKGKKDSTYLYINDINGARGTMAGQALQGKGYGNIFQYAYMTPEQIGIYNYLYNVSGKKAANKYLEYLDFSLYDQQNQAIYDATFEQTQKNVGTKIAASVASIPMNLGSGVGYLDVLGQKVAKNVTGSDKPINYNRGAQTAYTFTQGAREGTMEDMSDTGRFIYSTAMSMGDSLAVLGISVVTGGTAATALLGGSAATSTMHEAKKNGASDGQALAMGFVSGAAETIMEKLPLEELLNLTSASGVKAIVGQIVKQGANEATEEVLTTLVNTAADALIMGDKRELLRKYEEYIANGYSPEEAERLAKADWWKGLATDAVGGFVSGLTFGAGGTIIQNSRANADRRETGKAISTSSHTLPVLIEHVESGYTDANTGETVQYSEETKKTAQQIKTDLAAGKNISNVRKGKLAEQILKDNASFEADVLPGVMAEVQKREDAASSEQSTEKAGEEKPERNVIDRIKERLQEKTETKSGEKTVSPAAAKMLAEEVVDGDNYTEETKAVAQRIIDSEQVSEADSNALINGIKAENVDFSGYTAEEIIAEASVLAQEEAEQSTGTETTAETKTAAPKSTAQQTTTKGAMTNDQRTDGTGNEQRSTEDGTTRADRGRGRFSETYSGDTAPVSAQNRDVRAAKSRAQTASERQNKVADLRIEPTSAASLGINGGGEDATMYIIPEKAYDEELKSVAADAKANGVTVHFFTGVMPVNNSYANASVSGNEMYVRADSAKYTAAELYDHEKFHKIFRGKPGLITELYNWIRNNYTAESFDDIIDTYYDKYNDVYGLDEMSADDAIRIVLEEIFADAYAGTNKFAAGATEYTAPVRAAADAMGAIPSEYNANRGRAPPERMTYDSIKQAVREVLGETGAQNQLQGVEQISDAKNQQGLDMRQEVMFSISKDSLYMDNAIKMNESKKNVDTEDMNEAKALRAKVAARMIEIKDRGLVGLPEDKEGNTFISNSSYGGTEENTTVCPRSLAAEAFVDAVSEYLGRPLTIQEQIYISQDLQGRSLTPECTYCYVATDRKAYRAFLGEYIAQRDAVIEKLKENPNIDVTTLRADHQKLKNDANATVSPIGQIYKEFLNGRKVTDSMYDRFKMWVDTYKSGAPMVEASHLANVDKLMGDIRSEFGAELKPQIADAMKYAQSASWAKKRVSYVAYNGHILKWKQDRINKLNSHYGLRMYSFSDFHPAFVLENMQMLTDAAVRGLKVLGYTKDTDFVEIFAPTGMNINISTFGGIMDGVVFENDRIGASWAKAQELRNKYPNVGITFVATNDAMVEWALKQDWVDVVIPYHLVRTGTEIAKAFGYTNYTAESADTKRSDWEKGFEKSISPTEHNNDKETYLKALEKNRLEPRFKRYLENDNYMKLVNECRQPASLSEPVKPVFNEDAAMKALAKLEANGYYQPIGGSVDRMYEIAAEIGEELNSRPQQMFSLDDEGYDTTKLHWAYESGIIDKTDGAAFWHTIANIQKRGYSVPRSMSGEYIISSKRKLMFTDADYYAPTLTRVIVFGDTDSTNAESAKELIIGAETGIYNYEESRQLIEIYYGEQYISEYRYRDFGTDEGENGQRQGRNSGGVASATGKRRTGGVGSKFAISDEVDADGNSLTIDQQEFFAKSEARDDAGNLLVMYHGSQDAGFHIFDNSFSDDKTSFFFTDSLDVASSYSGTRGIYEAKTLKTLEEVNEYLSEVDEDGVFIAEYGGEYTIKMPDGYVVGRSDSVQGALDKYIEWAGVFPGETDANYKVYLNLTNPLVVDAQGRNWDNISTEFYPELYEQWRNDFTEEEKTALIDLAGREDYSTFKTEVSRAVRDAAKPTADEYTKAIRSAYWKNSDMSSLFSMASDNFSDDVLRAEAIRQMNTRDYAQRAKEQGYDGVIFKNVVDNGVYGANGASTVAIAFNSNQIKSVANKTPTTNPDIRFAISDEYDVAPENRDYLGEIVESADEPRLQSVADEKLKAVEELDEENEALRLRNMEYAEEANNYFDAYNYEKLDNERQRIYAVMQNALQNPDISAAPDTSAEHWESITAQLIEEKRRQKRENAVAEAENNDMYLPDGVSDAEILAAQEKYREQMAARKAADEAKYEGMTAEEAEAAKEADARRAQAEYLEGVDRKNFVGSEAMEKLKIKISQSIANYKSSAGLIERAKANAALVREMDKAIRKMHPSEEEKYFATGIMNNDLSEYSIPMHLDAERVLELADYMVARKAGRTDLFAAQKADINNRNRQLASDKFKNAEKAKRVSLTRLNYMTPRRAMIEMFGQEQGEEIYRTFFAPVRTNDAERIRFAERLRQEALEIVGADGKKGKLTKEERALTQMLMEGKAAGEMLAKMETGGKERIEAAAKRILKGEPLREENGKYVVGEEGADELSAKEAEIARRHAAYTQAQEAIRTGTFDKKKVDGKRITNAAKHFAQQYDMLYEAINEFLVAHGEQPIGFIKGYAPHLQAEDAMKPLERLLEWMGAPTDITDLRAEIAGETHNRKPNRKWNPHFLSRTVGSETEYDVYKGFEEYVDYISEVFYHMDDIMRLRAASRYLRTAYTTEDSKNQLKQIEEVRNGGYYEKMNFLLANNRIAKGEALIGAEIDEALDKYIDEILNEEENKTAVSSSLVMWLDNYTNLLAGKQNAMDRGLEQQIGRKGIRAVNKAVNRLISAQVVGNISSALNQMAQMPMTITELGADNVSKALWDLVRHSGEVRRWSTENDFLTARKGTTILNYQITDKLTNGLAKPLELADWLMSAVTARAAYHQALKQGLDVESAMDYSVQKAEDIMGSRNKASKPVAFSTKNPIMRLVNAYQIEVLNQWQHVIKDLPREYKSIAQSRGKRAAAGRIAKDIVLYLILAALINRIAEETYGGTPAPLDLLGIVGNFVASGNGLTLNEGIVRVFNKMVGRELLPENHTFDSEMPDEFDWGAAWEDTAYTLSSEIPFLNNILAAAGLTDDKTVFAAGVTDAIESGKRAVDHFFVTRTEREEGEQESAEILDGLYDVAMGVSEVVIGGRQLQKTIQGATAVAGHGEKNSSGNLMYPVEDTVGNWIKGTLFGKTALENSRAYYASGASPLNSTRNEQYFGMVERGVDEETAYEIAQGLADVTSDKDEDGNTISGSKFMNQMDFVMNADVPDEVKGFLALSIASDAAYERYENYGLEASGVDPAAFMLGWAFYQSATGKDKIGQTEAFLRQQGVSAGDVAKIIAALKKK